MSTDVVTPTADIARAGLPFSSVSELETALREKKYVADRVNAERSTIYQQRAAEQGVTPEEVGRVYAGQIINKAPAGTWFQNEDGSWIQR